ncbi:hypothetical protein SDC9_157728 [bioreactor metagenome]|uniref:Uncharacterized protein n=1 Tax=bioreactor metagenome TaxID=1076179 RepID=A0A645FDG9_9ZZZZ
MYCGFALLCLGPFLESDNVLFFPQPFCNNNQRIFAKGGYNSLLFSVDKEVVVVLFGIRYPNCKVAAGKSNLQISTAPVK